MSSPEGAPPNWTWVPTRGVPPAVVLSIAMTLGLPVLLLGELVFFGGIGVIVKGLEFRTEDGLVDNIMFVWMFGVGFPILAVFSYLRNASVRVGVGESGIRVEWRIRSLEVPWPDLRPGVKLPARGWATLAKADPKVSEMWTGWFWVTVRQAKVILDHPSAPRALFPPEFWRKLGVTPPLPSAA
jgi:hypothetical protein